MSKAFDKFEEEKNKIVSYFKSEKKKGVTTIKSLELKVKEKENRIIELEEKIKSLKVKYCRTEIDKESILQTMKSHITKEEEIEFVIEKFIKEKQEMEDNFLRRIEDLNHTNIELKVSYEKEVECLSQRIRQLQNNLDHMRSFEQNQRENYGLSPLTSKEDCENGKDEKNKENLKNLSNKTSLNTSQRFPNFGNYKIQIAEKDAIIEILKQKCDILEVENRSQSEKVNLLLEKLTTGNIQNIDQFKSLSMKLNYNSSIFKESERFKNINCSYLSYSNNHDDVNWLSGGFIKSREEELLTIIKDKETEIKRLLQENKKLSDKLKIIKENLFH